LKGNDKTREPQTLSCYDLFSFMKKHCLLKAHELLNWNLNTKKIMPFKFYS
jgi:hypothetical protein